ncbi:MAG: hypothetical protein WKG06_10230 [Segetibacter sp.]
MDYTRHGSCFYSATGLLSKNYPKRFCAKGRPGYHIGDISLPPPLRWKGQHKIATMVDNIAHTIPGINHTGKITGQSIINGTDSNFGLVVFKLKRG